jgi:hypothetical protein
MVLAHLFHVPKWVGFLPADRQIFDSSDNPPRRATNRKIEKTQNPFTTKRTKRTKKRKRWRSQKDDGFKQRMDWEHRKN